MTEKTLLGYLMRHGRPAAGLLTLCVLARLGSQSAGIALLVVPAWTAGRIIAGDAPGWGFAVWMIGLAVVKAALRYVEGVAGHVAAFALLARFRVGLYDALVPQAPAVVDDEGSGRLLATATKDIERVEVFYAHTIAPAVGAVLIPAASVVFVAAAVGGAQAAILGGFFVLASTTLLLIGRRTRRRAADELVAAKARLSQEIADDLRGRDDLLAFDAVPQRLDRMDRTSTSIARAQRSTGTGLALRSAVQLGWQLAAILVLLATAGDTGIGSVLLAIAAVPGAAPALGTIEALTRSLPPALVSARRLREIERREPAVADAAHPVPARFDGEIRFDRVGFAYPHRDRTVLTDVDLTVAPGEIVAVVGATGSGKSTLSKLLTRSWDPDVGSIRIAGTDLRDIALDELRRGITVVDQRIALLSGTVRENLLLAAPRADDADLLDALDAACVLDDIARLPEGLDTPVAEAGSRLSGGQAQRLALARGYLRRSPIMVLDEVTSHQDPLTQARMLARLRERVSTAIIIAHRDAMLDHVDRIVRVEEGRVLSAVSV